MTRKGRRLALIATALAIVAFATGLVLFALRDNVVFFYAPAEVAAKGVRPGTRLRIGGLVKDGSVVKSQGRPTVFVITDNADDIRVSYDGLLPDLFREGQGVVAEGVLVAPGSFRADTVLAKHDETYMPRDVAEALKKKGMWRGGENGGAPVQGASR